VFARLGLMQQIWTKLSEAVALESGDATLGAMFVGFIAHCVRFFACCRQRVDIGVVNSFRRV